MTRTQSLEERALDAHIRKRTVRLLDLTDKNKGGSGVTVKLEKHFFVATAAHVIPKGHDIRILDGTNQIAVFENWQLDKQNDVGFLELAADVANDLNREFATKIIRELEQRENWACTVVGYPGQCIELEESVDDQTLYRQYNFRTLSMVTELIPYSEWPTTGDFRRRPPQVDADVFVRFDSQCEVVQRDLTDLDHPGLLEQSGDVLLHGMSGCGIWIDEYNDNGIWRPEPSLLAIQTGAKANEQWARGTQFRCWLQLVVDNYPELTSIADQLG